MALNTALLSHPSPLVAVVGVSTRTPDAVRSLLKCFASPSSSSSWHVYKLVNAQIDTTYKTTTLSNAAQQAVIEAIDNLTDEEILMLQAEAERQQEAQRARA